MVTAYKYETSAQRISFATSHLSDGMSVKTYERAPASIPRLECFLFCAVFRRRELPLPAYDKSRAGYIFGHSRCLFFPLYLRNFHWPRSPRDWDLEILTDTGSPRSSYTAAKVALSRLFSPSEPARTNTYIPQVKIADLVFMLQDSINGPDGTHVFCVPSHDSNYSFYRF